jgi:cephalosporin-C deacetylase-like acetyl esterase
MGQFNPGYPNLLTYNIVDRHTYAYRGFYVDVWRGIDFLLARPEVDPTRIGVTGSSQGGGLTITTAAMRAEVRAAAAGAPYLCGFLDAIELTQTYPYEEINDYLRLYPERRGAVAETLAYFDGLNFADRITCPILVNIGLQDNVCPPETGYAREVTPWTQRPRISMDTGRRRSSSWRAIPPGPSWSGFRCGAPTSPPCTACGSRASARTACSAI